MIINTIFSNVVVVVDNVLIRTQPTIVCILSAVPISEIRPLNEKMRNRYGPLYGESRLKELWQGLIDAKLECVLTYSHGSFHCQEWPFHKAAERWFSLQFRLHTKRQGSCGCKEILSQIRTPTLVIHGEIDVLIPQSQDQMVRDGVKNSTLVFPKV